MEVSLSLEARGWARRDTGWSEGVDIANADRGRKWNWRSPRMEQWVEGDPAQRADASFGRVVVRAFVIEWLGWPHREPVLSVAARQLETEAATAAINRAAMSEDRGTYRSWTFGAEKSSGQSKVEFHGRQRGRDRSPRPTRLSDKSLRQRIC